MQIILKDVRLSFPSLFKMTAFGDNEPKYEATFLLDKKAQVDQIKALADAIKQTMKEKWGAIPPKYTGFVGDGDTEEKSKYDGYAGNYFAKATSKKRVSVLDRDKTPIHEEDDKIYGGCYVNVAIDIFTWEYQNKRGVSAWLLGVQFTRDGEPFGVKFDADKAFEQLDPIGSSFEGKDKDAMEALANPQEASMLTDSDYADLNSSDLPF